MFIFSLSLLHPSLPFASIIQSLFGNHINLLPSFFPFIFRPSVPSPVILSLICSSSSSLQFKPLLLLFLSLYCVCCNSYLYNILYGHPLLFCLLYVIILLFCLLHRHYLSSSPLESLLMTLFFSLPPSSSMSTSPSPNSLLTSPLNHSLSPSHPSPLPPSLSAVSSPYIHSPLLSLDPSNSPSHSLTRPYISLLSRTFLSSIILFLL